MGLLIFMLSGQTLFRSPVAILVPIQNRKTRHQDNSSLQLHFLTLPDLCMYICNKIQQLRKYNTTIQCKEHYSVSITHSNGMESQQQNAKRDCRTAVYTKLCRLNPGLGFFCFGLGFFWLGGYCFLFGWFFCFFYMSKTLNRFAQSHLWNFLYILSNWGATNLCQL